MIGEAIEAYYMRAFQRILLAALAIVAVIGAAVATGIHQAGKVDRYRLEQDDATCRRAGGYLLQGLPERGSIRFCVFDATPMPRLNIEIKQMRAPALPPLPGAKP